MILSRTSFIRNDVEQDRHLDPQAGSALISQLWLFWVAPILGAILAVSSIQVSLRKSRQDRLAPFQLKLYNKCEWNLVSSIFKDGDRFGKRSICLYQKRSQRSQKFIAAE